MHGLANDVAPSRSARRGGMLLPAIAFALVFGSAVPAFAQTVPTAASVYSATGNDAAAALNVGFRAAYAAARADVLAGAKPVILFDGEKLVLVTGGKREPSTLLPVKYQRLKALAHFPFTLYLTLRDLKEPAIEKAAAEQREALWGKLQKLLADVERELPTYEFTPEELSRQQAIVAASKPILDAAAAGNYPTREELLAFTRRMGPLQEANALAAAAIELDHYQKQADVWRKTLGEAAWNETTLVVCGSQMPRKRNRVVQLFAALFGVPGEGKRIIYAEGLYDPDKALNLFSTHLLDSESAAAFFDDPARLDEDLLSRGAAKYVEEHFPR